ncbi:MAG: insulinase family protein [Bacteroidales bacterium]|nr:insulinase family protein [Bacteroidales bacterium]
MTTKPKKVLSLFGIFAFAMALSVTINSCKSKEESIEGYKLIEKRFVEEVNADVYYFEHIKSGAHILKIASDDKNKTFGVGFKTEPNSDCGTPHIIEHSVLNGSKNFPVKSPFDELGKTSLKTFLNAFTASEWTFYPVASMNEKDYFNLMTVYMDAVFFPLIKDDERIFKQEGWHYELTDKNSPVVYKGVVYNEMKGSFSSPNRELNFQVSRNLFPDNGYGKESGGYPLSIPDLTYEDFLKFYTKNYHPANNCIFLYGNADMKKEMELIDKQYLSTFDKVEVDSKITPQEPFKEFKKVTAPYSVMEGSPTENQTYLSLNWVYGLNTDKKLTMALDILADVLVRQESAPIRLALQEAGIGKDVSAYCDHIQQNVFTINIQNANSEDADTLKAIVLKVLKEQSEKGVDRDAVEAYINRMEFNLREGDNSQKGLTYMIQSFSDWIFTGDPFVGMEWEKELSGIKSEIPNNYLEQTITKGLIDNQFGLLMVLEPKPGLEKEISDKTAAKLAEYKASLSEEQLDQLVMETQELIAYQQREDSAAVLATIPKLGRGDINPKADWYQVNEKQIAGTKVLHYEDFTNGVVYANLMFDAQVLPKELIPYASLLTRLLGKMDTENFVFGDLEKEIRKNTGTFYSYLDTYKADLNDNKLLPKFIVVSKAVPEKTDKIFELINEVIYKTKLTDKERLKTMLSRLQSQLESNLKNNGMRYAMNRSFSYFSNGGMFNEITGGLEYYWFINKLVAEYDQNSDETIKNLSEVVNLLFNKNNLIIGTSCDAKDYASFEKAFTTFASTLPANENPIQEWNFELKKKNEGLLSASKVQYVVQAYNYKKLGFDYSGKMLVLNNILSNDYLQNAIRVVGGAYGGFSGISKDGLVYFGSYRDPNLKETLDNYKASEEYLNKFEADEEKMLGYIIGAIANLDYPLTASMKADVSYNRYFEKQTAEQLQSERDALLATTTEDIKEMTKMITAVLDQNNYCVYGNKEKIEKNKGLFGTLINIDKK